MCHSIITLSFSGDVDHSLNTNIRQGDSEGVFTAGSGIDGSHALVKIAIFAKKKQRKGEMTINTVGAAKPKLLSLSSRHVSNGYCDGNQRSGT